MKNPDVDYHQEYIAQLYCSAQARKEGDVLRDNIAKACEIHAPFEWKGFQFCVECSSEGNETIGWVRVPHPCPTVRALKDERGQDERSAIQ